MEEKSKDLSHLRVGDHVKLTGLHWGDMRGSTVRVDKITRDGVLYSDRPDISSLTSAKGMAWGGGYTVEEVPRAVYSVQKIDGQWGVTSSHAPGQYIAAPANTEGVANMIKRFLDEGQYSWGQYSRSTFDIPTPGVSPERWVPIATAPDPRPVYSIDQIVDGVERLVRAGFERKSAVAMVDRVVRAGAL